MILYLDSSALLKLFVVEPGSDVVKAAVAEASAVVTHLIAYTELRAAFAKAVRMRRVATDALGPLLAEFEHLWTHLDVLAVTETLVRRAGDLVHTHGLRGYDSVHLAAVLTLRDLVGSHGDIRFGVFDAQLCRAGLAHNLRLLPDG